MSARLFLLCGLLFLFAIAGAFEACGDDDDDSASDDDDSGDDDDDTSGDDDDDSGDTWTDSTTGLMWQNSENLCEDWEAAIEYCETLSLSGYDDWRLPTISELRSIIQGCPDTETGGACGVSDDCDSQESCRNLECNGCDYQQGPGSGGHYWPEELNGEGWWFWSSSPDADGGNAWTVSFAYGAINSNNQGDSGDGGGYARCVR